MSMICGVRTWLDLPAVPPRMVPAIQWANVIDSTDPHQLMGVEAETMACATAGVITDLCIPVDKTFHPAPDFVVGDPFAVYTGVTCDIQTVDAGNRRASLAMTYAEGRAVEGALAAKLPVLSPTDISLAPPGSLLSTLGTADEHAFQRYGGDAYVWVPRWALPHLAHLGQLCCRADGALVTPYGLMLIPYSPPAGSQVQAVASTGQIFVTGRLTLLRGPVQIVSVPQQPHDGNQHEPPLALAERIYVPLFDCYMAKATFTTTGLECCGGAATTSQQSEEPITDPPELQYLSHSVVSAAGPPFVLHAHGENFTDDATIRVNGADWPTTYVSSHEITTVINPAAWNAGDAPNITVRSPEGTSAPLPLSFIA